MEENPELKGEPRHDGEQEGMEVSDDEGPQL